MSVQSRSDSVNTSLFDKREHIEKLHRTCNLLRKVQVPPVGLFSNCLVQQKVLHPFRKQKWSKGKQKEKVNNQVLFDQGTYDKLLSEAPKFKLITPSILSDRLRVHGELDTRVGQASSLSAQIRHFYPSLSATLSVGLRYDKHEKLRYTEGLVEIREDYIEDSHKGKTKSDMFMAFSALQGLRLFLDETDLQYYQNS